MKLRLSSRMDNLSGSATREILKVLQDKTIISFAGGLPATECLPIEDIRRIADGLLSGDRQVQILQYGTTDGLTSARIQFAKYVSRMGVECDYTQTLTVSGGQQGIDLMCKAFLNRGDVVLVQNPTYLAALQIIKSYEGIAIGVNSSDEGLDLTDLEQKIKKYNPKFLYVVPTFSNPTGTTYTIENRKQICKITAKHDVFVLEDDPYSRLRFEGEHVPALKHYDEAGNVVYLTSFSKVVSPGLRIGVAVGGTDILRKLEICKQGADVHSSHLSQAIVEQYLAENLLDAALEKNIPIYKHRKDKMAAELRNQMPSEFSFSDAQGGLFLWGQFSAPIDCNELFKQAIDQKVAFVQGSVFFADPSEGQSTLRLNFSNSSDEKIERGVAALARVSRNALAQRK